jgi:hypothetical protein
VLGTASGVTFNYPEVIAMLQFRHLVVSLAVGLTLGASPAASAGSLVLSSGQKLQCIGPGIVLDHLVACEAPGGNLAHANLDDLDRAGTEKSLGVLTWYILQDGSVRQIAPPDPARKQPDPRVLASLRAIQGRMEDEADARDARDFLASEQAERAAEQERKLNAALAALKIIRPILVAARCRAAHPDSGVAQELCRLNG